MHSPSENLFPVMELEIFNLVSGLWPLRCKMTYGNRYLCCYRSFDNDKTQASQTYPSKSTLSRLLLFYSLPIRGSYIGYYLLVHWKERCSARFLCRLWRGWRLFPRYGGHRHWSRPGPVLQRILGLRSLDYGIATRSALIESPTSEKHAAWTLQRISDRHQLVGTCCPHCMPIDYAYYQFEMWNAQCERSRSREFYGHRPGTAAH